MTDELMGKYMPDEVWLQYNYGWKSVEQVTDGSNPFKYVRAATSKQSLQVPDGFALMPIRPTEETLTAMEEAFMPFGEMVAAYDAMIAATRGDE